MGTRTTNEWSKVFSGHPILSSTIQFQILAVARWNATVFDSIFPSVVYNSIVWQENLTKTRHQNIDIILNVFQLCRLLIQSLTHSLNIVFRYHHRKKAKNKKEKSILNLFFLPIFPVLKSSLNFPLIGQ